jgi:hypothetical protein
MERYQLLTKIRESYLKEHYNYRKVSSQIKRFEEQGMTYSQINDILYYWYVVKGNDPEKSNGGIAIIDYILEDYKKWKKDQENQKEILKVIQENANNLNYKEKKYKVNPTPIKRPLHLKFFNLE